MEENLNNEQGSENASDQSLAPTAEDVQQHDTGLPARASGPQQEAAVAPVQRETEQANNFRAIKDAARKAARERDEALERLAHYERMGTTKPDEALRRQVEQNNDSDLDLNLKDDELAEGKHLHKLKTTIRKLEAKQKELEEQSYTNSAETRLRSKYNDFDKVMTLDNIKTFSAAYPELAESINSSADLYSKAVSAYTLIKRFGIYDDQPYEAEKNKAIVNTAKPRPLTSIGAQQGDSPLSRANAFANGLTEELKKQLREEMAAASRKY